MPFCPECKYEYVQGINQCPDCRVDMVDELPQEKKAPEKPQVFSGPLVTVATLNSDVEAEMAKMRIEAEGIPCVLAGSIAHRSTYAQLHDGVRVQVREQDAHRALEILQSDPELQD